MSTKCTIGSAVKRICNRSTREERYELFLQLRVIEESDEGSTVTPKPGSLLSEVLMCICADVSFELLGEFLDGHRSVSRRYRERFYRHLVEASQTTWELIREDLRARISMT